VLSWGVDFSDYLDLNEFEVIEFHRVSEVQQHIDMILPPRSVFLQKSILMQDSENLFELLPKARIDVLKLLFGLDMIDSVRDQIGDKKNELRGQYKVLSESSHIKQQYDERYNEFVKTIQEVYDYLGDDIQSFEEAKMLHIFQTFIKDPLATYVDSLHYDLTQRDVSEWTSYWNSMLASKISINEQMSSLGDELNKLNGEYDKKKHAFMLLEQNVRKINPQQHQTHTHKDALEALVNNKKQKSDLLKKLNESIPDSARNIFGRYMIESIERTLPVFQSSMDQLTQL
jgi:DNA repair exonuclease SbcCD ATPase subunit